MKSLINTVCWPRIHIIQLYIIHEYFENFSAKISLYHFDSN